MPVPLYMDVHVPQPITDQLRHRGVDVLTAIEDGARELADAELLQHAGELGRVIFTQDVRFKGLAWIPTGGSGLRSSCEKGPDSRLFREIGIGGFLTLMYTATVSWL